MRKLSILPLLGLLLSSCGQNSIGPVKGVLVVYPEELAPFIDQGGLEVLQRTVDTVEPENVFSWAFAGTEEFHGTLRARRVILILARSPEELPGQLSLRFPGVYSADDVWARNQHVIGAVVEQERLPEGLGDLLEEAYNTQVHRYIYGSFVSTQMSSPDRLDSLLTLGFTVDVPKAYSTRIWRPDDGFIQYQRVPGDECLLMFSIRFYTPTTELTEARAVTVREAMARRFFFDASADSVDRSRVTVTPIDFMGIPGMQVTGMWRNPEHLNAGSFTARVLQTDRRRYIMDMQVYHPGREKELFLREGWIMMDTFREGR